MLLTIFIRFLSFSHLFVFGVSFFLMDKLQVKSKMNYLLFSLIIMLGVFIGLNFTYIDIMVVYIFFLILSIRNTPEHNVVKSLFIVSSACSLEIILSKLAQPFLFFAIEEQSIVIYLIYFILYFSSLLIFITVYNKWLLPKIEKGERLNLIAYLLTVSLFIYLTYYTVKVYASTLFLKLFVSIFYIVFMLLGGAIIQSISKNQNLKLAAEKKKIEYEMTNKYSEEVKRQYEDVRKFRHDYVNIITSIEYYLESNEIEELKKYFNSSVKNTKSLFKKDSINSEALNRLKTLEIKSIISMKLLSAQEKGINLQIEINENISLNQTVDSVVLVRILGILLDNAIEEVASIGRGKVSVAIFKSNSDLLFVIQNPVRKNIEPLKKLKQKGFSTKGNNRGLGLSIVDELSAMEPKILLETEITNEYFIQKVLITG